MAPCVCSFCGITKDRYEEPSYRFVSSRIVYVLDPPRRTVRSPAEAIPWVPRRGAPCHGMRRCVRSLSNGTHAHAAFALVLLVE